MKKKLLLTLGLAICVTTLGGQLAEATNAKTETDAEFSSGGRPDPSKPEEGPNPPTIIDPDVDPEDPGNPKPLPETDGIYVTHLPNISFGQGNKLTAGNAEYEALTEKITQNQGAIQYYVPHFAQVADLSGSATTTWRLTVEQDDVYTADSSSTNTLEYSRIRIYENSVRNSSYDNASVAQNAIGVNLSNDFAIIPVATKDTTTAPLEVAASAGAGLTNNTYTSSVFINDYNEDDYDEVKAPSASRYSGIRLNVPQEDQTKAEKDSKYTANLTWTLSVTP